MKDVEGGVALNAVASIIAARVAEAERVLSQSTPAKKPARRALLETLRLQLFTLGRRKKDAASPSNPELTAVPLDQLGALCALASGKAECRRELRDVAAGTALEILEILERRAPDPGKPPR